MAHTLDSHNASLSEGGGLAVVVRDFPETSHWTRDNTDFLRLMQQSEARLRLARPPSHGAAARRTGGRKWWERPHILAADAPRGRGRLFMPLFILLPCLWGRSHHHRDPFGKDELQETRTLVVLLNLALTAAGL